MDLDAALSLFWARVERSSLRAVAKEIPVSHTTAVGWRESAPTGVTREKLIAWAERAATVATPPTDEVLRRAAELTAYNLTRLQEIRGYAKFVYDQLLMLAGKQGEIVAALEPYAGLEADAEAEKLRERAEATLRAASAADPAASATTPARQKRRGRA